MIKLNFLKNTLIAILFTSTFAAQAQDDKFRIGFKGGLNLSNLYTNDDEVSKENMLVGYHAGVFFKIPINERLALQPEAIYSTQGAKYDYKSFFGGNGGTLKFKLDYINIPVLAVVNVVKGFSIHAGPYIGILTATKLVNDVENGSVYTNELKKNDFNTTDVGLAAGLSFDLDQVSIGARYNYGLSKVGKERTVLGNSYTFPDARNSNIQVFFAISLL